MKIKISKPRKFDLLPDCERRPQLFKVQIDKLSRFPLVQPQFIEQ
jgi:hypothetical protein